MISPKEKSKAPKDSMTLLPCFYFVEVSEGPPSGPRGSVGGVSRGWSGQGGVSWGCVRVA